MAKKTIPYVWVCQETKKTRGSGEARPDTIAKLQKQAYSASLRKRTLHKAKAVKKGGTKKSLSAK